GPELELVLPLVEDVDAGHVGRQEVGRELQAGEVAVERARERLGQHRLADAREVLDDRVPFRDEAEDDQAQRRVGCMDDPAEVSDDRLDQPVRGRFDSALSHFGAQPLWISVSTSSRIAAAISSFGAFATVRSPAAPRSVTSLSEASKPMSGRETSLRTKRSAPLRASLSRARARPASPVSAAKPTRSWPSRRRSPSTESTSVVGSSSSVQAAAS